MSVETTDVLISGLGPVGAALAVYLGRRGISAVAIDRDTAVYPMPRAAHLDHETMRLLHLAGGAEAVSRASQPLSSYEFRAANGDLLMGFRPGSALARTGFPVGSMFHQPTLEHALRDAVSALPGVSMRLGHALAGFKQDGEGVSAEIAGPDGSYEVRARYLVGCDGGQSLVRRLLGIELDDMGFDEPWLVVDAVLKGGRERLSTIGLQHCDPRRPVTSMPMAPGRHRWEFMLRPGETAEEVTQDAFLEKLVAAFADPAEIEFERRAVYRFHAVFARTWRVGRVLLAGDAAHQMPPFLGQGLCSGARDAANLAWKLTARLKGQAGDALLDSYQRERDPHVRGITEMAVFMGKIVCTQNEEAAAARDRDMTAKPEAERFSPTPELNGLASGVVPGDPLAGTVFPEPWVRDGGERRRIDDVAGFVPMLISRSAGADDTSQFEAEGGYVASLADGTILDADADGAVAALLEGHDAILVRPDRYIFGRGSVASLMASWRRYLATGLPAG